MQRDGDRDAIGRRSDADLVVGCRHPDRKANDLPGRSQPLRHQRQRERQYLRRLQRGDVERFHHRGDLGLAEGTQPARAAGCPASSALRGRAAPHRYAARSSTTLGGPTRASARCLSSPGTGVAIRPIASAAASWNLRVAASIAGPSCAWVSACSNSRACTGAPSRLSHCHTGSSEARRIWPGRTGKLPSARNGSSGRNDSRAGSSLRGCDLVVLLGLAHDLAQLLEHEIGGLGVLAALHRALEFAHQQRQRLRRKLRKIVSQPLGRCLTHAG